MIFLRASAAAGAATLAVPALLHAKSPNSKLNVAVIGPCGRGEAQLEAAAAMENVVAVCDIDDNNLAAVARQVSQGQDLRRFPQDARRDAQVDRRGDGQHAGP